MMPDRSKIDATTKAHYRSDFLRKMAEHYRDLAPNAAKYLVELADRSDAEAAHCAPEPERPPSLAARVQPKRNRIDRLMDVFEGMRDAWLQPAGDHRQEHQLLLLRRVMGRLGIDDDAAGRHLGGTTMQLVARACSQCTSARRCTAWLAETGSQEDFRWFCPNAGRLEVLKRLHAVRSPVGIE